MNKPIAIIAGEPNSISSEIIFKSWKYRKKSLFRPFFIIGSYDLLNKQKKKLKFSIKLKKIDNIRKASSSDYEAWQRIAMLAGWSDWELGIKKSKSKQKPKKKKATTTWKR